MALRPALTLLVTLSLGCTPEKDDSASDATTSTAAGSTSTAADTTMATDEPTSTTVEPTTGEADALSCQPPPLVGEACAPAGETRAAWYLELDGRGLFVEAFDTKCSVDDVGDDGETQTLTLGCDVGVVRLDLTSAAPHVPVAVAVGATVHVQLKDFPTLEIPNYALALRDADGRLLAAAIQNVVFPRPAPLEIAPLTIDLLASDCEPIDDGSVVSQRAGLSVTIDGMAAVVFDGNTAGLGLQDGFQIVVGRATRELCTFDNQFNGEPWGVDALIVLVPEG